MKEFEHEKNWDQLYIKGRNGGKRHLSTVTRVLAFFTTNPNEIDPKKIYEGTGINPAVCINIVDNFAYDQDGKTIIPKPPIKDNPTHQF